MIEKTEGWNTIIHKFTSVIKKTSHQVRLQQKRSSHISCGTLKTTKPAQNNV